MTVHGENVGTRYQSGIYLYTPTPELEKMTNSGETLEGPEQEDCHGNSPGKKNFTEPKNTISSC